MKSGGIEPLCTGVRYGDCPGILRLIVRGEPSPSQYFRARRFWHVQRGQVIDNVLRSPIEPLPSYNDVAIRIHEHELTEIIDAHLRSALVHLESVTLGHSAGFIDELCFAEFGGLLCQSTPLPPVFGGAASPKR